MEAEPVISDAEPKFRWLDFLQTLDVAFPRRGKPGECMQNPEGNGPIDCPKLHPGLVAPDDPLTHVY